jgi:hypothetical protein
LLRRLRWVDGLVDPDGLGQPWRPGRLTDEPLRVLSERGVQDDRAGGDDPLGTAMMDVGGGQQPDAAMTMLEVVPAEEGLAERSSVLEAAEPIREGGW